MNASAAPAPGFPFFGGHRWVYWPIALLPAVTLRLSFNCMKNGNWPTPMLLPVMLLIVMLMACLWEAHAQALRMGLAGKGMLWQVCERTVGTLLSLTFAGLLPLVLIVGVIGVEGHICYAKVYDSIQVSTAEPRREIERRASVNKTLKGAGVGLQLPKQQGKHPSNGFVLEDGVIVLVMEEPLAAVLVTPKLVDASSGAIEWSCRGYPARSMPGTCR